jgi:hypothetical protein
VCGSRYLWMMLLCVQLAGLGRIEVAEEVGTRRHPKQTAATGNAHPCTHYPSPRHPNRHARHYSSTQHQAAHSPQIVKRSTPCAQVPVANVLIDPSRCSQPGKPPSTISRKPLEHLLPCHNDTMTGRGRVRQVKQHAALHPLPEQRITPGGWSMQCTSPRTPSPVGPR